MRDGDQLGFDALLQDADAENVARVFATETAHLPCDWTVALEYHRNQITAHHAAMLASDFDTALAIRKEACLLARKLNNGQAGILAGDDAPGCQLDKHAAAADGTIPLWGQSGQFDITAAGLSARCEMKGMFGIGSTSMPYLGFSLRALNSSELFLSNSGYRSFLGASVSPEVGMTTEGFVRRVITAFVEQELRGKLVRIDPDYFKR
ncbi:MAG: hypothetical protein AAFY31_07215 [Pseudomonadota bacterium]